MSDVSVSPVIEETDTGEPTVAHIATKSDITRGYVLGVAIKALCGEWFTPSRSPDGLPTCTPCREIYDGFIAPLNPDARKNDDL